jgi:galactonate dehydratase
VPWFGEVFDHPLRMEDGCWTIPESAGYGLEINEQAAARYPFKQEVIPATEAVLWDGSIANW